MTVACDRPIVMVTRDPRAAAVAARVLYLVDVRFVLDQHRTSDAEMLKTMNRLGSHAPV